MLLVSAREVTIVGRKRESAALARLIARHAVVALHGEPGVGKTALVRAVVAREAAAGRLPPPLVLSVADVGALRDVLELAARALGRRRPVTHDDAVADELARLV